MSRPRAWLLGATGAFVTAAVASFTLLDPPTSVTDTPGAQRAAQLRAAADRSAAQLLHTAIEGYRTRSYPEGWEYTAHDIPVLEHPDFEAQLVAVAKAPAPSPDIEGQPWPSVFVYTYRIRARTGPHRVDERTFLADADDAPPAFVPRPQALAIESRELHPGQHTLLHALFVGKPPGPP